MQLPFRFPQTISEMQTLTNELADELWDAALRHVRENCRVCGFDIQELDAAIRLVLLGGTARLPAVAHFFINGSATATKCEFTIPLVVEISFADGAFHAGVVKMLATASDNAAKRHTG